MTLCSHCSTLQISLRCSNGMCGECCVVRGAVRCSRHPHPACTPTKSSPTVPAITNPHEYGLDRDGGGFAASCSKLDGTRWKRDDATSTTTFHSTSRTEKRTCGLLCATESVQAGREVYRAQWTDETGLINMKTKKQHIVSAEWKELSPGSKATIEMGAVGLMRLGAQSLKHQQLPDWKEAADVTLCAGQAFVQSNTGQLLQHTLQAGESMQGATVAASAALVCTVAVVHTAKACLAGHDATEALTNGARDVWAGAQPALKNVAVNSRVVRSGAEAAGKVLHSAKQAAGFASKSVAEVAAKRAAQSTARKVVGAAAIGAGAAVAADVCTGAWEWVNGRMSATQMAKKAAYGGIAVGVDTAVAGTVSAVLFPAAATAAAATGVAAVAAVAVPVACGAAAGMGVRWLCSKLW